MSTIRENTIESNLTTKIQNVNILRKGSSSEKNSIKNKFL